jgi:hypothetical protein
MMSKQPPLSTMVLIAAALAVVIVVVLYLAQGPGQNPPPPATATSSAPLTQTAAARLPPPPRSYMELVLVHYPDLPATQPLERSLSYGYAGHIVFPEPIYLDGSGHLWITREDAPPDDIVLREAQPLGATLTRLAPVFVHWMRDDEGTLRPWAVCPSAEGGYDLVSHRGVERLTDRTDYDWDRAFSWLRRIVVPTSRGVSVFTIESRVSESPSPPLTDRPGHGRVEIAFLGGPIAWLPPHGEHPGSGGAVRLVEDVWFRLGPDASWPAGLIHILPLLDGSVLQIIADGPQRIRIAVVLLDRPNVDDELIGSLIGQLSDPDPQVREKAAERLTQYGPALWAAAERLVDSQPPEAQARLRGFLRSRIAPRLGNMQVVEDQLQVMARFRDGGALFYAPRGVAVSRGDEQPQIISPAWLTARPQQPVRLLPADLAAVLTPGESPLIPCGADDWMVCDLANGPRLYQGNGTFLTLLRPDERAFSQFVGLAQGGKLLFRPAADSAPGQRMPAPTLIIDPTLPDPRPRLPVWLLAPEGTTGWDEQDWPAAQSGDAWSLRTREWRAVDRKTGRFFSRPEDVPPWPVATLPMATSSSAASAAAPTAEGAIYVDSQGTRYFDGRSTLRLVRSDGTTVIWPLPPEAVGESRPWLLRTANGRLFLLNRPGRIVRIKPTADPERPFEVEAIFTRRIPDVVQIRRMWLDPAGRIAIVYDTNRLAVLYPDGYVPAETMNMIPAAEHDEMLRE